MDEAPEMPRGFPTPGRVLNTPSLLRLSRLRGGNVSARGNCQSQQDLRQ